MNVPQPLPLAALFLLAWGVVPSAQAEVRTFRNPVLEGYRLSYCKSSGSECGERVATEWCVTQGFEYASDWALERDIGAFQPTISVDNNRVCHGDQCDGFSAITCGREERVFRVPTLGGNTRGTVFTPDQRQAASAVTRTEIEIVVPGCSQFEPGVLLCYTVPEYQYCRSLLQDGFVLGCRVQIGLDNAVSDLREATAGSYELSLRARASVTINQGSRGDGRVKGETRYRVKFAIPEHTETMEACLQRDRYEYHQTGPSGGSSKIYEAADCDEPLEGSFSPHEDEILHAYDLCERHRAWGTKIEATTDLIVAGIFHFSAVSVSTDNNGAGGSRTVAPYMAIGAPLEVICRD